MIELFALCDLGDRPLRTGELRGLPLRRTDSFCEEQKTSVCAALSRLSLHVPTRRIWLHTAVCTPARGCLAPVLVRAHPGMFHGTSKQQIMHEGSTPSSNGMLVGQACTSHACSHATSAKRPSMDPVSIARTGAFSSSSSSAAGARLEQAISDHDQRTLAGRAHASTPRGFAPRVRSRQGRRIASRTQSAVRASR